MTEDGIGDYIFGGISMKPILFNTKMVRAILDGRKTVTRRVMKPPALYGIVEDEKGRCIGSWYEDEHGGYCYPTVDDCSYQPGDILYVRETWKQATGDPAGGGCALFDTYVYKADGKAKDDYPLEHLMVENKWNPSIHMPKEAARLFLRVTDVSVERLQDITEEQALLEGVPNDCDYPLDNPTYCPVCKGEGLIGAVHPVSLGFMEVDCPYCDTPRKRFSNLWDSTIKKADMDKYGWAGDPWVWVIEFERISKEEALGNA